MSKEEITTYKSENIWANERADMLIRTNGKCLYCDNKASRVIACNDYDHINLDNLSINNFKPVCETEYINCINIIRIKARERKPGNSIIWELEKDGNIKEIFRV